MPQVGHWLRLNLLPFSVLEGSVSSKKNSWIAWPLKVGPIGCPETSVTHHPFTLRKNYEQRRFQDSSSESNVTRDYAKCVRSVTQ